MSTFPLCERAGLKVVPCTETIMNFHPKPGEHVPFHYIPADRIEALLEKAPEINLFDSGDGYHRADFIDKATHTARLIMIEPMVKNTAESLLREIVDRVGLLTSDDPQVWNVVERAKALLEGMK